MIPCVLRSSQHHTLLLFGVVSDYKISVAVRGDVAQYDTASLPVPCIPSLLMFIVLIALEYKRRASGQYTTRHATRVLYLWQNWIRRH